MPPPAVTPSGVRDGDPVALAGLCEIRGPSVLAYCRHVVGDADAGAAAADAFARFRAAVVATGDLTGCNPEALLVNATRKAAASRAARQAPGVCAEVPSLLAARADRSISTADIERLERHLDGCWACRAPVARFQAAERAYRDPPEPAIDPAIAAQIFVALAATVPALGAEPPAPVPGSPSPNGSGRRTADEGRIPVVEAGEPEAAALDQPTTEHRPFDAPEQHPGATGARAAKRTGGRAGRPARPGVVTSLLALLGLRLNGKDLRRPLRLDRPERERGVSPPPDRERGVARAAIGTHPPRVDRAPARRPQGGRARPALPLSVVLPIALVLVALLMALFVSGVFGGSDPASSPRVSAPDDAPADTAPADTVVVPRTENASADAVEQAKARVRARAKRQREPVSERAAAATPATPPPAATSPPPAPSPPAAPATNAANRARARTPAPDTRRDSGGGTGSKRRIDARNGATGAEQIPPAQDSSAVPDLAPPPEPATTP